VDFRPVLSGSVTAPLTFATCTLRALGDCVRFPLVLSRAANKIVQHFISRDRLRRAVPSIYSLLLGFSFHVVQPPGFILAFEG
jgi:hypothetical protein